MSESRTELDCTDDLMALDMEYRLTIGFRLGCECAPYFIRRREALMPEVLRMATEKGEDPVDFFAAFARRVHARHEAGGELREATTPPAGGES